MMRILYLSLAALFLFFALMAFVAAVLVAAAPVLGVVLFGTLGAILGALAMRCQRGSATDSTRESARGTRLAGTLAPPISPATAREDARPTTQEEGTP